jgi:hypothetical protein
VIITGSSQGIGSGIADLKEKIWDQVMAVN